MEITKHEPGMFSWADLASTDEKGSRRFYTELLGLNATAFPMGEDAEYVVLSKDGKSVCAMYEMSPEVRQQAGGRPFWHTYFTVESADDAAAQVKSRGGAVVREPFDVMGEGRMAVAQDPTGAVFLVWEPKSGIGAQVFGEPGALAWSELYTHNTEAASDFYAGLFGWSVNRTRGANNDEYFEFQIDGRSAAGMMAIKKEWGEMPPHWSIYFAVADLDASIGKAKDLGAQEVIPPMEVPDVGRLVFIQDPQGAYFAMIQIDRRPA